jgi:hypothetical protein
VPASATSVTLNWTNNALEQAGYHLDRATDPGFTRNLITENLPATPTDFTDTATGLAPGGTFYYRLRAFNAAGDSRNSNVASVTIPLAPPKPTNQQVTGVTTTEIALSWQDNAGHQADGYHILRGANHGAFTEVASLPASNHAPPSTYTWTDTGLTPGTFYEYHIIAFNVSGNNDFAGTNATTLTDAPAGLTTTAGNAVVNLSWTAPAGALSYNVYRGTAAGGETLLTNVTTTTYADTSATNGTTWFYFVTALNGNGAPLPSESAGSNEVSATPAPGLAPVPPGGGTAPAKASSTDTNQAAIVIDPEFGRLLPVLVARSGEREPGHDGVTSSGQDSSPTAPVAQMSDALPRGRFSAAALTEADGDKATQTQTDDPSLWFVC